MSNPHSPKRRNRINEQFTARLIQMLESPAYRALSRGAHLVISRLEIELAHHGGNDNGHLPVTKAQFIEYGIHNDSVAPAIREAMALGFIRLTERGRGGNADYRSPNKFYLTFAYGRGSKAEPPTHDWRKIKTVEEAERIASEARKGKDRVAVTRGHAAWAKHRQRQKHFPVPETRTEAGPGNQDRNGKFPGPGNQDYRVSPETRTTSISGAAAQRQQRRRRRLRRVLGDLPPPGRQGEGEAGAGRGAHQSAAGRHPGRRAALPGSASGGRPEVHGAPGDVAPRRAVGGRGGTGTDQTAGVVTTMSKMNWARAGQRTLIAQWGAISIRDEEAWHRDPPPPPISKKEKRRREREKRRRQRDARREELRAAAAKASGVAPVEHRRPLSALRSPDEGVRARADHRHSGRSDPRSTSCSTFRKVKGAYHGEFKHAESAQT